MKSTNMATLVVGGLALLAAGTYLLPGSVQVERSATLPASAAEILALAGSNLGYQRFNPYRSSDPDLKIEPFGPSQGVGSGFRFEGKGGTGSQTVAALTDTSVDFAIDLGRLGQPRQRIEVAPVPGGSRVVWSMRAELGLNPVGRVMGLFMDRIVGPQFETGLKNLHAATARS